MVSMVNTFNGQYPERPVTFIHAAQNGEVHAMGKHITNSATNIRSFPSTTAMISRRTRDRELQLFIKKAISICLG